jgi:hypothetical protein
MGFNPVGDRDHVLELEQRPPGHERGQLSVGAVTIALGLDAFFELLERGPQALGLIARLDFHQRVLVVGSPSWVINHTHGVYREAPCIRAYLTHSL